MAVSPMGIRASALRAFARVPVCPLARMPIFNYASGMTTPQPVTYIGIINSKGGVGKTTLAMMLAHALTERGHKTVLFDSDDDGSAFTWAQYAEQRGQPLPFPVVDQMGLAGAMAEGRVRYVVVDTPANNPKKIARLAAQAQYLIIPIQPGELELDRLNRTWEILNAADVQRHPELRVGFVLNSKARTTISEETLSTLQAHDFPIVGWMSRKVGYQRAYGKPMPFVLTHPATEILTNMGILN